MIARTLSTPEHEDFRDSFRRFIAKINPAAGGD
jgi:hypothetical protein